MEKSGSISPSLYPLAILKHIIFLFKVMLFPTHLDTWGSRRSDTYVLCLSACPSDESERSTELLGGHKLFGIMCLPFLLNM